VKTVLACALLACGCNAILDLDPPSAVVDLPSCETGWMRHATVTVHNDSGHELRDYQLRVHIDAAAQSAAMRFVAGEAIAPHEIDGSFVWINVPLIPPGESTLELFTGGTAEPIEAPVFVDVIANPSFEQPGGWSIDPPIGTPAVFNLESTSWASDGLGSLRVDAEVSGHHDEPAISSISQPLALPLGTSYVLRFDVNVLAASNDVDEDWNNGALAFSLGNGLDTIWWLSGHNGNITGARMGEESRPFAPGSVSLAFSSYVERGDGNGYVKAYVDHLRVRKYVDPEPTAEMAAPVDCP
jgi:hypothetical protein